MCKKEEEKKEEYITDPENQWVPEEETPPILGINVGEEITTGDKLI
jgi:hypothetical protein